MFALRSAYYFSLTSFSLTGRKRVRLSFPFLLVFFSLLLSACDSSDTIPQITRLPIREGRLYGYIDEAGQKAVAPQFAYAMPFSEGMGAINVGGTPEGRDMPEDGKWGFVNDSGRIIINPKYLSPNVYAPLYSMNSMSQIMHEAYIFSEGLAAVRNEDEWVYINVRDSVVISGLQIQNARKFSEGLAAVMINGLWGYINKRGAVVIQPQYVFPVNFKYGKAFVLDPNMAMYCIDRSGRRILSQFRVASHFHEGVAALKGGYRGEKTTLRENLKLGLLDTSGFVCVEPQFDKVGSFGDGLCPVLVGSEQQHLLSLRDDFKTMKFVGGRWGFVDIKGRFVINPQFDEARGFSEGLAPVKVGDVWGYMDKSGGWAFKPQFSQVSDFQGGAAYVTLSEAHSPYAGKHAWISHTDIIWTEP